MSRQRALVRFQAAFPDCHFIEPGEIVEWEGLNWKLEPIDAGEREEWDRTARDDARVENDRRVHGPNEWRFVPADKTPQTYTPPPPPGADWRP